MNKSQELLQVLSEEKKNEDSKFDVSAAIKEVIETTWSESDDEAGKVINLLKGLIFADNPKAKKFIKAIDALTSKMDPKEYE